MNLFRSQLSLSTAYLRSSDPRLTVIKPKESPLQKIDALVSHLFNGCLYPDSVQGCMQRRIQNCGINAWQTGSYDLLQACDTAVDQIKYLVEKQAQELSPERLMQRLSSQMSGAVSQMDPIMLHAIIESSPRDKIEQVIVEKDLIFRACLLTTNRYCGAQHRLNLLKVLLNTISDDLLQLLTTSTLLKVSSVKPIKSDRVGEATYSTFPLCEDAVSHLIDQKVDVNKVDSSNATPLINAVKNNNTYLVKSLLYAGAKLHVVDIKGKNAFDYSREHHWSMLSAEEVDPIEYVGHPECQVELDRFQLKLDQLQQLLATQSDFNFKKIPLFSQNQLSLIVLENNLGKWLLSSDCASANAWDLYRKALYDNLVAVDSFFSAKYLPDLVVNEIIEFL